MRVFWLGRSLDEPRKPSPAPGFRAARGVPDITLAVLRIETGPYQLRTLQFVAGSVEALAVPAAHREHFDLAADTFADGRPAVVVNRTDDVSQQRAGILAQGATLI